MTKWFSDDYREARSRFMDAASRAHAAVSSFECPEPGPDGKPVWMDIAVVGPARPEKALVLLSGTHGAEGFFGSACQTRLLESGFAYSLPAGTALVLVHAINPHGFAHLRRTNEHNIDLNRNFQRFELGLPPERGYREIHEMLVPTQMSGVAKEAADAAMKRFVAERGFQTFFEALTSGQHTHPGGLFFGGVEPSWSQRTWFEFMDTLATSLRRAVVIDFHTGLGAWGEIELLHLSADDARARAVWGSEVKSLTQGESNAASTITGTLMGATLERYSQIDFTAVGIELGTLPVADVLEALRYDAWLFSHPQADEELVKQVRRMNLAAFRDDDPAWQDKAIAHGDRICASAVSLLDR